MNKMNTSPQKGRKGYKSGVANDIIELCRSDFYSVAEMCRIAGIGRTTFYKWMNEHQEFRSAILDAKDELREHALRLAHNALLRKIQFQHIVERKVNTIPGTDAAGNRINIVQSVTEIHKEIPPDTRSIIFALTNLDPEHWKRRAQTSVDIRSPGNNTFTDMSDEDLQRMIDRLKKKIKPGCV